MWNTLISFIGLAVAAVYGQNDSCFEPENFSITAALAEAGVDVTTLPGVSDGGRAISPCASACTALRALYGQERVLTQDTDQYENFTTTSYYSVVQRDVNPFCVFKPSDETGVSVLVLLSRLTQCPFAVKSGGHGMFEGSSSLEGGITVSLEKLTNVTVSSDKSVASVQAGNKWGPTYARLAEQDLTVMGGRLYSIGVGGLTTGGGISYFANLRGWACDNVASYDVITAKGTKVNASPTQNADLYWALRGGGPNFGIVTQFNYETLAIQGTNMWGGQRAYLEPDFPAVLRAFTNVAKNSPEDKNAGQWIVFTMSNGTKVASTELWYGKPNGNQAKILSEYFAIPAISDTTQNRKVADYARSNDVAANLRAGFYTMTFKNDEAFHTIAKDIFYEAAAEAAKIRGATLINVFQSITKPQLENMAKNGSNPLGLKPEDGPLTLVVTNLFWTNPDDGDALFDITSDMLKKTKAEAAARGLANNFTYMNYAAQFQDVIASYGAENKARLQQIAKKYDPQGVFQTLSPGYFKLDRAAVPGTGRFSF